MRVPLIVIAALLGHACLDTVMIDAKLYPDTFVEGHRAATRSLYSDTYQPDELQQPTAADIWRSPPPATCRATWHACLGSAHR